MVVNLTLKEISAKIKKREVSPVDLVEAYLERIDALEPDIQAWVVILKERSLQEAKVAEKEILSGNYRGPLHGIPYGVKDIYYTAGIKTSAGSKVNENFVPDVDATVIERLRDAGAIMLGKTTTTEYAFFGGPPPTRNPWNREHTPGGSSSGSAAALAASMAAFTLGSQTAGSLSRPASFNGLTTLKGTYGRVSRAGIIPASWSVDHAGAFTRTVEDTALVLQEIAGYDHRDPTTRQDVPDYAQSLLSTIENMILGVPEWYFSEQIEPEMVRAYEEAIQVFQELGAKIIQVSLPNTLLEVSKAHSLVMKGEYATYHAQYYQEQAELYNNQLREMIELGLLTSAVDYVTAQRVRQLYRAELVNILQEVDALITPAALGKAPKGLSFTGSPILNVPFTTAGVPTLAVPAGMDQETGLPLGIQLVSKPWAEETLIRMGYAYQEQTNWHKLRPVFPNTQTM